MTSINNKIKTMKTSKFLVLITAILLLLYNITLFAGNTNNLINNAKSHRDEVIKEILKNNNGFLSIKKISMQKNSDYQQIIEAIKNKHQRQLKINEKLNTTEQAIVFVSFSMPDLSLKQIINDASRYKIPVVIRGLYKNSFRETVNKIFELVKENNKGGIAINPRWFRDYEIKAVPAVVISSGAKSDVVYGNILIKRSLSIIAERGETSAIARDILNRSK
ncbi:conjugal transfer pilus assembly protein TrbC [Gammaproteobacteria bacterium]